MGFDAVSLPDGMDWLMRPVMSNPPLCSYKDLHDGSVDLLDIDFMNSALDVMIENSHRATKSRE